MSEKPPIRGWWEVAVVLVLTAIAAGLRTWHAGSIGLTHFDEGVYALAGLWGTSPLGLEAIGTDLIPYAPPGYPILVGISFKLFGASDLAAIGVSQAIGILTIPLIAWIGRRTFGPGAGAGAAALAAVSGVHVAFSRMALTDVSFLFAWLASLGLGGRFLERPGLGRALAFGAAVGLAQNFKYNGWLAGGIVILTAIAGLDLRSASGRRQAARTFGGLALAAGVAGLVYMPWFLFVERQQGGYGRLLDHHRGYVRGFGAWLPDWKLQMDQAVALAGGPEWGAGAWSLAWLGAACAANGRRLAEASGGRWVRFVIGWLAGAMVMGIVFNLAWWVALGLSPWIVMSRRPAVRVVGMGWLVMSVLTPLYHPYARLWLPLHASGWLILGGTVGGLARAIGRFPQSSEEAVPGLLRGRVRGAAAVGCAFLAILCEFADGHRARPHPDLLQPTKSLREDVQKIRNVLPAYTHDLRLLARPPVLFYLHQDRLLRIERAADARALEPGERGSWGLVEEIQLRQEGDLATLRSDIFRRWDWVVVFYEDLSVPTLLDQEPAAAYSASELEQVPLWVLRPKRPRRAR